MWNSFGRPLLVYLMAQQHKCTSGTVLLMAEGVDDFFVAALLLCDLQFNTYIHTYIHHKWVDHIPLESILADATSYYAHTNVLKWTLLKKGHLSIKDICFDLW